MTFTRRCRHHAPLVLGVELLGLVAAGCTQDPATLTDGNVGLDPALFPNQRIAGEPNDSFADPLEVVMLANRGELAGTISNEFDVDVYALGPVYAGDRLIVDVGTPGSPLDPVLALFNEGGELIIRNDDRNLNLGQYDPFVNEIIRHDNAYVYVALAASPAGVSTALAGAYEVLITLVPDGIVPDGVPQTILLDFDGGSVDIPGEGTYTFGPFDTADIAPAYADLTAVVRDQIAAAVLENYEGLALDLLVTPGDTVPAACTYSTVLFGGRSPRSYGVASNVDAFNHDQCDDAVIFAGSFTPSQFGRLLTAEELGRALGNVASHEIGHLLGLHHTANAADLMDTTASALSFLTDQEFMEAELDDSIFPIGTQDGFSLLLDTLGTAP